MKQTRVDRNLFPEGVLDFAVKTLFHHFFQLFSGNVEGEEGFGDMLVYGRGGGGGGGGGAEDFELEIGVEMIIIIW